MATNAQILAELQTAAQALRTGGMVEDYTLPDGTRVRSTSAADLEKLIAQYKVLAEQDTGTSRFRLARLRPAT